MLPYRWKSYSLKLLFAVLLLNLTGLLVIRSATNQDPLYVGRELMGTAAGIALMLALSVFPYQKIMKAAVGIFIACLVLLVLVNIYGRFVGGARRWIVLPVIGQLQPSEFAKVGIMIFFSWLLDRNEERINQVRFLAVYLSFAFLPVFLIASEPDLSSTIVVIVCIAAMLYVSGLSYKWIGLFLAVAVPLSGIFLFLLQQGMIPFLKAYQARRILAFLNRSQFADDNLQQDNSIMAIGSGQLFGKGLNNNTLASVKNGNFLSEEQTDFIFAVIGEELGFVGCILVLLLFSLVVFECFTIAGRARDMSGKVFCGGMGVLVAFQGFCNIAVATGLLPNTGLTLPFISYGVSSLLSFYMGTGVVLNIGLQSIRGPHFRNSAQEALSVPEDRSLAGPSL